MKTFCNDECLIKECIGAFIVPIGSRGRFEPFASAAVGLRKTRRIVKCRLPSSYGVCQRAEQGKVVFASEEQDVFVRRVRQHAEILIQVCFPPTLVPLGTRTEGDVVIRSQKVSPNQAPACRRIQHRGNRKQAA